MSVASIGTASGGPDVTPGTVPAWAIDFWYDSAQRPDQVGLTIGSDTYDGSVAATLAGSLTGGSYEFVIEGMTDEDYAKIRQPSGARLAATLYLWWQNSGSGIVAGLGRFTGLTSPLTAIPPDIPPNGLVAQIRVDTVRRRAGDRRYDVVVTGRELVVARLADARVDGKCYVDLEASVFAVAEAASVPAYGYGIADAKPSGDQPGGDQTGGAQAGGGQQGIAPAAFAAVSPGPALAAMITQAEQAQAAMRLYGQPVAMIRDGALYVGQWTADAISPRLGAVTRLGADRKIGDDTGLLSIERGAVKERAKEAGTAPPGAPVSRPTITVTALGRPDIKPGDTVTLSLPPEDFPTVEPTLGNALLTSVTGIAFGGSDPDISSRCRVTEVTHRLSRQQGFVTTFQAVVLAVDPKKQPPPADGDDGWDKPQAAPVERQTDQRSTATGTVSADSAHGTASAIGSVMRGALSSWVERARSRMAIIHDHPGQGVPQHTSDVWIEDTAPDGFPNYAQRVAITPERHSEMNQVPYVTPFAWGSYGLVLPRYPGTRVLLAHTGGGNSGDLVDIGAIWPIDSGPAAQPGDYWLALPISVPDPEHLAADGQQLPDDSIASHDLIDAQGSRVIETTQFVVRVTDNPTQVPNRPTPGDGVPDTGVTIETKHTAGKPARITLDADGNVVITGSSITLDTQGNGDIELKANNIKVQLGSGGTMDVS